MKYHTKAVGVTFENRQTLLSQLPSKVNIQFIRDYDNKYDKKAVAIIAEDKMVGYLPKGYWVSDALDKGIKFRAEGQVTGGKEENKIYGLNIEYEPVV